MEMEDQNIPASIEPDERLTHPQQWLNTTERKHSGRYSYSAIGKNEIRLLRISQTEDGCLVGHLRHFSLASWKHPGFIALSYVWGPRIYSDLITLDGQDLPILRSLSPFLKMLCCQHQLTDNIWWWIDSICIDEENIQERGSQVQLMGSIFRQAKHTVVWLGEKTSNSDDAIDFLHFLHREKQQIGWGEMFDEKTVSQKLRSLNLWDETHQSRWKAVESLFLRPWWRRVWTVQEFIISPYVTFCCGEKTISRSTLASALYAIWMCGGSDATLFSKTAFDAAWNRRRLHQWFENSPRGNYNGSGGISLVAMMSYLGHHSATDPRDRIYSLLGLAMDAELAGRPSYDISVEEVYCKFVKSFVERHQSLDIICFAHIFNRHVIDPILAPSLPSWVPDWRVKVEPLVVPLMVSQSARDHIGNLRPLHSLQFSAAYSASGNQGPQVRFSQCLREITCEGILLDFIDGLGGVSKEVAKCQGDDDNSIIQSTSSTNISPEIPQDSVQEFLPRTNDIHRLMTAISRCLVLDRKDRYLRNPAPMNQYLRDFQMFCSATMARPAAVHTLFRNWFQFNKSLYLNGLDLESLSRNSAGLIPFSEVNLFDRSDLESFLSRFRDTIVKMARRLVVTNEGHVGMAPYRAKKGDIICVLFSCSVPVVLRKQEGKGGYEFIGECFIDGYMNGEALDYARRVKGARESFRIS